MKSQICQRKVLCKLRVIDVLTEYYKIKTDRMRYKEGGITGFKITKNPKDSKKNVECRERKQKKRVWEKANEKKKRKKVELRRKSEGKIANDERGKNRKNKVQQKP